MKTFDMEQYSPEWWGVRRGVPTASNFGAIITPKKGQLAAAADSYAAQLIGDRFDPQYPRIDRAVNDAMRNGTMMEPESRAYFELHADTDVKQVGFCLSDCGRFGCSPDGLTADACLELKNPQPKTQVEYLLAGGLPDDYRAQVHGHLVVTGLAACWFMSYCPGLPILLLKIVPDDFTAKLRAALDQFHERYMDALRFIEGKRLTG